MASWAKNPRTKSRNHVNKNSNHDYEDKQCFIHVLFQQNLEHVLEQILLYLPIKDLLNCRLVNKEWRLFIRTNLSGRPKCRKMIQPKVMELLDRQWLLGDPTVINTFILTENESKFRKVSLVGDEDHVAMGFGSEAIRIWNRHHGKSRLIFPWSRSFRGYHFLALSPEMILIKSVLIAFYHYHFVGYVYDGQRNWEHVQSIDIAGKSIMKTIKLDGSTFALATKTTVEVYSVRDHGVEFRTSIPAQNGQLDSVTGHGNLIFLANSRSKCIQMYNATTGELLKSKTMENSPNLIEFHYPYLAVSDQKPVLSYIGSPKCIALFHVDNLDKDIWFSQDHVSSRSWQSSHHLIIPQSWSIMDVRLNSRIMVLVTGSNPDAMGPTNREIRFHIIPIPPQLGKFEIRAAFHTLLDRGRRIKNPVLLLESDILILQVQRDRLEEWNFWMTKNEDKKREKLNRMKQKQEERRLENMRYWMRCKTQTCF